MVQNDTLKLFRRRSKEIVAAAALALMGLSAQAQVNSYVFSQSNGTFTPVSGGTLVDSAYLASTSNSLDSKGWSISLPFTFEFNNVAHTSCYVTSNGLISFGTTNAGTSEYNGVSSTTAYQGAIAAMNRDLWGVFASGGSITSGSNVITGVTNFFGIQVGTIVQGGTGIPSNSIVTAFDETAGTITLNNNATSTSSSVSVRWGIAKLKTQTLGTAPNRSFVIEWSNFSDYNTSATNSATRLNFQVILEETTNKIHIVYGDMDIQSTTSRTNQVGLRGLNNTDYNSRTGTTGWDVTTASTTNSATVTRTNTIYPASGLTYTWTPATCLPPSGINMSAIGTNTATVAWNIPSSTPANGYEYYVSTTNSAPTSTTTPSGSITAGSSSYIIPGLSPATPYYLWVRSLCSPSDISNWSLAVSFTTNCLAYQLPFVQTFNNGSLPVCWNTSNGANNTNANSFWKFTGAPDYGAATSINGKTTGTYTWVDGSDPSTISDVTLTSPMIELTGLTNPAITFEYFSNNTNIYPNNIFKVDVNNGNGWVNIFTDNTSLAAWRTITAPLPPGYAGTTAQFRFVVDKTAAPNGNAFYNDILLDSVSVSEAPTCNVPVNLTVTASSITSTEAAFTWSVPVLGTPAAYQWEVRTAGAAGSGPAGLAASGSVTAPTLTATATNLTPGTTYTVYLRSDCGATDQSSWIQGSAFTTLCPPIAFGVPFNQDFESSVFVPACWSQASGFLGNPTTFNATPNNYWNQQNYGNASVAVASSTNKSARLNLYGTTRRDWIITPSIDLGTTPRQLEFDIAYTVYYGSATATLGVDDTVAVIISIDNGATWSNANILRQWGSTTPISNGAGDHITIDLSAYTGIVKFGFYGSSTVSNVDNDLFIDNVSVVTNPCPVVNLGPDVNLCAPASFSQTLNAGNPGATYLWDNASTAQTRTITGPGIYYVDVTVGGCTTRDSLVVTFNPLPIVDLGPNTAICSGSTLTLNAGNAGATYLWNTAATTQTITVSTAGTYYVAVTAANSCVGRDTIVVTLNPSPVVNLGNDTTVCEGSSATLNAGNTGATFLWSNTATTQSISVSTTGTYFVTVTGANNCTGSDTLVLTVNEAPVVSLGNDTAICEGNVLNLDVSQAGASYLWDDASTNAERNIDAAGTYYVIVTDANDCSATDSIDVTVNALPSVDLGPDMTICEGVATTLDAGNAGADFAWDDATTAQTRDVTTAGEYYVWVTDGNGCSNSDTVAVSTFPSASGTINVTGSEGTYNFSIDNAANVASSAWDFGDGSGSNDASATHTYTENGAYTVTLMLINDCGDTARVTRVLDVDGLSIGQLLLNQQQLSLYPNPARSVLNISNSSAFAMQKVTAFNILGQMVYTAQTASAQNHQIQIGSFAAGVYTLKIETNQGIVIRKFEVLQ